MFLIICERETRKGVKFWVPIVNEDDDNMAVYDTLADAEKEVSTHILCSKSRNIIVDTETGKSQFAYPE